MTDKTQLIIFDDNKLMLQVLKKRLEKLDYLVEIGDLDVPIVDQVTNIQPDLAIIDICMPVKDGFTLAEELKADDRFRDLPLIAFTAAGELESYRDKYDLFDEICLKTEDFKKFVKKISSLIEQARLKASGS